MDGQVEPGLLERVEPPPKSSPYMDFEARVRYLASSLIVTIPARIAREMGLKLGDRVLIRVRKKESTPVLTSQGLASSSRRLRR